MYNLIMRIHSFEPIVNSECRIIILGSIPGIESLRKQEYYGHPQNKFWDVLYGVFKEKPDNEYSLKKLFLLNHGIALWDVIKSCERKGSADSAIKNIKLNDFYSLFTENPRIKCIFFNGRAAENIFKKNFSFPDITSIYLGSTSPAHAVAIKERICDWSVIPKRLLNE